MDNNFKRAQEAYDRQEPPEYWEGDTICDHCNDAEKCLERCEDLRGWIYEEQFTHCLDRGKPSYEDDECWAVPNEDDPKIER
jgi:hypothetical protein